MALTKRQRRELKKQGVLDNSDSVPQRGLKLRDIAPKTENQQRTFESYYNGDHLLLHGIAGTGKTFISLYLALQELFAADRVPPYNNITIIRSVVPTRDIGFLPGKEEDKIGVYEAPYKAITTELFNRGDAYDILKHKGLINFMCTSFVRGVTLNNTIVIVDEVNNLNFHELDSVITRIGNNCRVIFCGDFRQSDLSKEQERNGLQNFMKILNCIEDFSHIEFDRDDIVRSKLVRDYIVAKDQLHLVA